MATSTSRRMAKHRRRKPLALRGARFGFKTLVILAITAVFVPAAAAGVAVSTLLFTDLPGSLPEKKPGFVARPSFIYDGSGRQIGEFRTFELTVAVQPDDVPQVMFDAVVAAEDQRFYEHRGVDLQGVARAAVENYREGETVQGGSTITQQYIKNAYLNGERTLSRKLREAVLATQLERQMTKDEILFSYLDSVYFGSGAYGVGAAAQSFFGKPVNQLNLSEAATLAGVIPAPTAWSPRVDVVAAEQRRTLVLDLMVQQGMITESQHIEATNVPLWLAADGPAPGPATLVLPQPSKGATAYPHFVDWVEQLVLEKYGPDRLYRGGLRIETSLDPALQELAMAAVANRLKNTEFPVDMSLVSVDPATGLVRAMVGGRDYNVSQVNLATGGSTGFQPGSSFKTFVLAAALERGIDPETVYKSPIRFEVPFCEGEEGCFVRNYGGGGGGSQTLRKATWSSTNTVYAALTLDVGPAAVAEVAERLGVSSIDLNRDYGISIGLGAYEVSPLDMAASYATIAAGGVRRDATPIVRVLDEEGHILEDNSNREGTRVMTSNVAANVTDVLTGVVDFGTARAAALGRPAAGKTGTAENYQAAWFAGYTPQLATAVWMGHVDGTRALRNVNGVGLVSGGSHPTIAWGEFMRNALNGTEVIPFPEPGPLRVKAPEDFKPGGGVTSNLGQAPGDIRTPDTSVRAPIQQQPIATPTDCNGPCKQYTGEVIDASVFAPPTTIAAPERSAAAPTTSTSSATAASPTTTSPTAAAPATTAPTAAPPRPPDEAASAADQEQGT